MPKKMALVDKDFMSIRIVILLLYFFSGFSALVYEITWARMLGLIIGTTVAAWGTVLAVYMGGMALGARRGKGSLTGYRAPSAFLRCAKRASGFSGPLRLHCCACQGG